MKVSTILDHIDSGHMALPEFQRGYVWNRDQVRGLFDVALPTASGGRVCWCGPPSPRQPTHRGDGPLAAGVVKLLLDGQQRMTSLYGVGARPAAEVLRREREAFTGLRFHLETETFAFYPAAEDARTIRSGSMSRS